MKKTLVFLMALGLFLLFPVNNASADIWAKGVSQASGWFDAEKDSVTPDDENMCWAASAADILMWSRWNVGYANEDQIFDFFVAQDPIDAGGWQQYAWKFWFDGSQMGGHFGGSSHGGYYSTAQFNAAYAAYMVDPDVMSRSASLLQQDYGVGFGVFNGMAHAITLWGIKTDPTTGAYLGVWVTDSDNNKGGPDPRPNTLDYYNVLRTSGNWYLQDFYGYNNVYIEDIQTLKVIPVPAAVWLGMLGLGAAGWKLRRHADPPATLKAGRPVLKMAH